MMISTDDLANSAKYTGFRTNHNLIRCWFVQRPVYLAELARSSVHMLVCPEAGVLSRVRRSAVKIIIIPTPAVNSREYHYRAWLPTSPPGFSHHLGDLRPQHGCHLSRASAVVRLIGCSASASSDKCALYVVHSSMGSHHFL